MIPGLKVTSYKRGRRWVREKRLTAGPAVEGVTGGGTFGELWGHDWASVIDRDRGFVMLRAAGDTWTEVATLTPLPVVDPKQVRHHGVAFDGSARPTWTWEQGGAVYLRQWDPITSQVVTRGPFPGCDPVLINDVMSHREPAQADVLLAYLSPDRTQLLARIEHEVYATPHALATVPAGSTLDQVVGDPVSFYWLGADPTGTPWARRSSLYPYLATDTATLAGQALDGAYQLVVIQQSATEAFELAGEALDGAYQPVVIYRTVTDQATLAGEALDGAYQPVVIFRTVTEPSMGLEAAALDGGYTLVLISRTETEASASLSALAQDGTYEPA